MRIKYEIVDEAIDCYHCDTTMKSEGKPEDAENWAGDALVIQHYRCPSCGRLEEHTIVISARRKVLEDGALPDEGQR